MRILFIAIIGFMWLVPRVALFQTDQEANGLAEDKIREIQNLRQELNLEAKEQPRVSEKTLAEVDAIREEIMSAVQNKQYVHGSDPTNQLLNAAHLWGTLGNLFKRRRIAAQQEDNDEHVEEDSDFHIQFPHLTQIYREVLHLDSVEEDMSFDLGDNVVYWKTLHQRKLGKHSLIGITNSSVVLLNETDGHYEFLKELELPSKPTNLEGFVQWDVNDRAAEGIVLVSIANELLWIDLGTDFDELTITWRWNLHKNITEVDFFSLIDEPMVILISEASLADGRTSADIYRFDYGKKDFWLVQTITLTTSATSVAVLENGPDLIIAVPQENVTELYKYIKDSNFNRHFVHFLNFDSPLVAHVASFRIGGHSHLAIGGINPQIWRLEDDTFESVEIRHNYFGMVDFWLPIVATTYRDDLIILVQHRVQLETHIMTKLEVLVWNGEFFSILPNVPCILSDIQSKFGISCMLDFDRDRGLEGATIIRHGKNISILVPRDDADSGLFVLNMEMKAAYHPEQEHLEEFKMMYDYFSSLSDYKDRVLEDSIDTIKNALKMNEFNTISAEWTVKSLETTLFEDVSGMVKFGGDHKIAIGEKIWTLEDSNLDIPTISDTLNIMEDGLNNLLSEAIEKVQNRVSSNSDSSVFSLGSILNNGRLSTEGMYVLSQHTVSSDQQNPESNPREKRQINSTEDASIEEVIVKYLEVDSINGIPVSDLVFSGSNKIAIESDLIIDGPLEIEDVLLSGKVNGKFLQEEVIETESETYYRDILEFGSLDIKDDLVVHESVNGMDLDRFFEAFISPVFHEDVIADENITISGDLTFTTINGVNWEQFIRKIIMTNLPIRLEEIRVKGEVSFMDVSRIDILNKNIFPDSFLWASNETSDKPSAVVITGEKKFKTLVTSFVDAEGTINGVAVDNVITINSDQHIPGNTTFSDLQVVGDLEIDGKVHGKQLDKFLENPTLLETRFVKSACVFRDLRVEGSIIVNKSVNGIDLQKLLSDAIYTTDSTINVTSFKSFDNVIFNSGITLTSNILNGVSLNDYVTKDTEQELFIKEINGDIYFHSLDLDGLFNSVNITELDYNTIKLSGQQHTEAEIIFENDDLGDFVDVVAGNLEITDTINGFKKHDLIDISDDFVLNAEVEFEKLSVDHMEIHGNLTGEFLVNDINLDDFYRRRLSLSGEQTIDAPFYIEHAQIDSLNVSRINNFSIDHIESLLTIAENLEEVIKSGVLPVDFLTVHGNVNLEMVNGQNFSDLAANAIWLNETNVFSSEVNFLDKVIFHKDLFLEGKLNEKDIEYFIENIVQKSNDPIILAGQKTFKKGLYSIGDVNVNTINSLNVSSMLTQNKNNVIHGDLVISGNLTVKKLIFNGKINSYPVSNLMNIYSYDPIENFHHIYGDIYFADHPYVHNLVVDGCLNNLDNVTEFMQGIQMKNQKSYNITGRKIFLNDVVIENSLHVNLVNDIDFQDFVNNVVLIDDPRTTVEIHGNVTFLSEIIESPEVFVRGNLTADTIMGCSPYHFISQAVWKDRDMEMPMNITFDRGALNVESIESDFLNGIPMSKFITLHTEQEIEDILVMPNVEVNQPIRVDGFVNGKKLPEEHENTLMVYGDQIVETSVSFHQARVLNSLTTTGLVNNQNIRNVAFLNSDLMITTPVSFNHLKVKNVFTDHIISGINFTEWYDGVLWRKRNFSQTVRGRWVFKNFHIEESLEGDGSIDKIDFVQMMIHFSENRHKLAEKVEHTEKLYYEFCHKINDLLQKSHHDICFFRYFEQDFTIREHGEKINSHLFYENNGQNFFIHSVGCRSKLHQWSSAEKRFNLLVTINTGQIDEWIHVEDSLGHAHLVANGPTNPKCNETGSAVWKWTGSNLFKVTQMDQHFNSILRSALHPGHFYAIDGKNMVTEYDIKGKSGEKWGTSLGSTLRFIPQEVTSGLAVTDGKRIKVIQDRYARRRKRVTRSTDTEISDYMTLREDSGDSFVNLLMKYSDIIRSNKTLNTSESFEQNIFENEIVGDKLFDKFQDLMKQGSKTFVDTSFKIMEILNKYEKKDEEKEKENYEYVGDAAENSTDPENLVTKEEFLNTLRYVLLKKKFLIDVAMGALSEVDPLADENSILSVIKVNATALRSVELEEMAEDAIDFWLMELLMNDKINEIDGEEVREPLEEVHLAHNLQKLNKTASDTSQFSNSTPLRVNFPEEQNLTAPIVSSDPMIVYSEGDPSFEELTGEFVVLTVGHPLHRRKLIAAASRRKSTIRGPHDVIYLYENRIGGTIFQTLSCQDPTGLTALHLRDETLLIFVEAGVDVQIYSYQGIMGFKKISHFHINSPALHLTTISLPVDGDYRVNYLVVTMKEEILFLEAKMMGNCRVDVEVNCDE